MVKGSDLFVAALENEGVEQVFGIPGEENLDAVESLRKSHIKLVVTRHEQSAAFMAATYGRLTGGPGCASRTLGPGGVQPDDRRGLRAPRRDAHDHGTGQKAIRSSRQARFQIVDMVATMKPLTKFSRQIVSASSIPTLVREAFRIAAEERPGPVHLELPEDIAAEGADGRRSCRRIRSNCPWPPRARSWGRPAMILAGEPPARHARRRRSRPHLAGRARLPYPPRVPFFTTQMGKGASTGRRPRQAHMWLGTAALSERDYVHEAIDRADLILSIGHDTVEKPPFIMGPGGPTVIHVS